MNGFSIKRVKTVKSYRNQQGQLIIMLQLAPDVLTRAYPNESTYSIADPNLETQSHSDLNMYIIFYMNM